MSHRFSWKSTGLVRRIEPGTSRDSIDRLDLC
jgi:hypothetical protein